MSSYSPITIYTENEINLLREGGRFLAQILNTLKAKTVAGVTTLELDKEARKLCEEVGAVPAFLNYTPGGATRPFPGAICISVNEEIVHGIPNENPKTLKSGDVVVLDMGLIYKGLFTDSAVTIVVGGDSYNTVGSRMIQVATEALAAALATVKPGVRTGTVGHAIEKTVLASHDKTHKFSLPYELGGHGIGHGVHEDPFMPNFGKKGSGPILREGMVLAIEPILTEKSPRMKLLKDGYTYATQDKGLSVHVEHTIVVTKNGCEILTEEK
ncbi:MAG: type I methionyl aminopeptidase [Patescibacteria group bacterium]